MPIVLRCLELLCTVIHIISISCYDTVLSSGYRVSAVYSLVCQIQLYRIFSEAFASRICRTLSIWSHLSGTMQIWKIVPTCSVLSATEGTVVSLTDPSISWDHPRIRILCVEGKEQYSTICLNRPIEIYVQWFVSSAMSLCYNASKIGYCAIAKNDTLPY